MIEIREISIVIVANNNNPTILNPDFLKYNKIVPESWELAAPPLCTEPIAQVKFKSNVGILAQFDKLVFTQSTSTEDVSNITIPEIASKYVETLPHVSYSALGINPKGYIAFKGEDEPRKYIVEKFLASGPWSSFGDTPVKSSVKFVYTLSDVECHLTVDETTFKSTDKESIYGLLFSANFHHEIKGDEQKERLSDMLETIANWESDLKTYLNLVEEIFMR